MLHGSITSHHDERWSMLHKTNDARLKKLRQILERLKRGEIVQNRQLRTWLGEEGYKEYEAHWDNVVDQRNLLSSKPGGLREYEDLLKKAILLFNRGETASLAGKQTARLLHAKAQSAFEYALLRLQEMMEQDPSLQMWLDRHCDFSAASTLSLDPVGMPRVITSRSLDNQSGGASAMVDSKRQCKIAAVQAEIDRIINPSQHLTDEEVSDKLKRLRAGWK